MVFFISLRTFLKQAAILSLCSPSLLLANEDYAFPLGPDHTPTQLNMSRKLAHPPAYNEAYANNLLIQPSTGAVRLNYESLNLPGGESMGMLGGDVLVSVKTTCA